MYRIDTPPVGERAEEYEEFYPDDASDEALAWRLMREEERMFNQRLLAMASVPLGKQLLCHNHGPAGSETGSHKGCP